jgi:L-threonylcarbamoyladenylate synthase
MCNISIHDRVGSSIPKAVAVLQRGGLVAFPTETYYGLAVDPECEAAVSKLFQVKRRQAHKPLLLLIDRSEQLTDLVSMVPEKYLDLMNTYWPGPLTLVFPARENLSRMLTGDTGTIGIRISPHPLARELIRTLGKPVTATSANLSGGTPAKTADEVLEMFQEKVDYILDGGATPAGLCSTVVGLEHGNLIILREGQLDASLQLAGIVGEARSKGE